MSDYYVIAMDTSADVNVYLKPLNNMYARLQSGDRIDIDESKFELPFRFEMKVRRNPDGSRQVPRFNTYDQSKELMHKSLVEVLQNAGVDNLQLFPAIISEKDSEKEIEDYVVVNVVGLVSSTDAKSESIPFSDGLYFRNLVIDPTLTHGLLMFRLAEFTLDLLIHERVADLIKSHDFPYLSIMPIDQV